MGNNTTTQRSFLTIVARLIFGIIRRSWRIKVHSDEQSLQILREGGALICCWHQCLLGASMFSFGQPYYAVISRSKDGQILASALHPWGVVPIFGSSTNVTKGKYQGGSAAYRAMLKHLKDGHNLMITPDGPKGPAHICKAGALRVAQTGATVVPASFSAWPVLHAPTWDRMRIPLPFARIHLVLGASMILKGDPTDEQNLCDAINQCHQHASRLIRSRHD